MPRLLRIEYETTHFLELKRTGNISTTIAKLKLRMKANAGPAKLVSKIKCQYNICPFLGVDQLLTKAVMKHTHKLFEEIKVMFKDLPSRIESNMYPEFRRRKKRRFHPMIVEEIMHISKNSKVGIMAGLSMIRDMMPWLYDVGIETLRILDSN